jgi:ATP-dependent DNA ligase
MGTICACVCSKRAGRRSSGLSLAWMFSEALAAEGTVMFAKACELEGIVSKRADSLNKSRRSRNWLKTKNPDFLRT